LTPLWIPQQEYLAHSVREFDHGTINVPRGLRPRVQPRQDFKSTSRPPAASSTTAGFQEYLAASGREFGHGKISRVPRATAVREFDHSKIIRHRMMLPGRSEN